MRKKRRKEEKEKKKEKNKVDPGLFINGRYNGHQNFSKRCLCYNGASCVISSLKVKRFRG